MITSRHRFAMLLALACGCTRVASTISVSESEPEPEPQVVESARIRPTSQASALSGPLEIETGGRLTKPSDYAPSREIGMTDEPYAIGWSEHTGEFLVCTASGGADCRGCNFHRVGVKPERVETGSEDCNLPPVPAPALQGRIAAGDFHIEDGAWAYGATVVLVVEQKQGEPDSEGIPRGVVQIGARLRTPDAKVAWIETIFVCIEDGQYCAPDVHVDAIAPAPDGQSIAVLMHSFAGEFTDTYPLRLLDADSLAAAAYEQAGLEIPK